MRFELGAFAESQRDALEKLERDRAVSRVWAGDASLWKSEPTHRRVIENALGWLTIADRMADSVEELESFAGSIASEADRVIVLGMGGSSLAPLVFASSFARASGFPGLEILDSTEPSAVLAIAARTEPRRALYVVSSKSGTTLEPNILFDYFFDLASRELGPKAGERFLVITDPGSALEREAATRKVRRVFPGDPTIGGRYSALSNFGIVPAALAGIRVGELLARARVMAERCRRPGTENPGLALGAAMGALARSGRDKLTFAVGPPVERFGMWLEQLVAESTGKEGRGILPVEGEPLGDPGVYGDDRFFASVSPAGGGPGASALARLVSAGHPAVSTEISDALDLGAQMFLWEFATAISGAVLGIDPFDQPNVQEAKDRTNEILGAGGGRREAGGGARDESEAVAGLLASIRPHDYFAITAYLPSTEENETALNATRLRVRDAKKVATTLGFGPRFLHSTGQLHKGGPDTGVFLQVTAEPRQNVPIPGKPWDFGQVVAAQAAGDLAALESRGRRAARVHLPADVASGLRQLDRTVAAAVAGAGRGKE
jgi:glucose-6-phosphate isomerase